MRNYGQIKFDAPRNEWVITADRHIMLRLKRVFEGINKYPKEKVSVSNTPEHCCDLEWFVSRYPLEIISGADELASGSTAFTSMVENLDAIADPNYTPKVYPLVKPLREYQSKAVQIYLEKKSLLVGDDVGLGKTAIGIGSFTDTRTLPALVITHVHLLHQWQNEIKDFMPGLTTHIIKTGPLYSLPEMFGKGPDVVIINYHKLAKWANVLSSYVNSMVIDEVQELSREGSQKYDAANALSRCVDFTMGLSATPINNYGGDMFNVLDLISPGCLGSRQEFVREWCHSWFGKMSLIDPAAFGAYARESHLMLRRSRKDVGRELKSLTNITHVIDSDSMQAYDESESVESLAEILVSTESTSTEKFLAGGRFESKMRKATGLAKAKYVADFVNMLVESGEKVVLFGWHRAVYEVWMDKIDSAYLPQLYTGSESPKQKMEAKEAFIYGRSKVLIMSLRSGAGLDGLQYSGCRTVVYGEQDWSPAKHEQGTGRVHRDGQPDPVLAYYLISEEGCDPFMVDVLGIKREQSEGIKDPDRQFGAKAESVQKNMADVARSYLERKNH